MNSCIYRGVVRHRRHEPVEHKFSYRLFMMYLDLDELPAVFDGHSLWSARGPAPAWFRRADYLGSPHTDLRTAVLDEAERLTGLRPTGPVRMLTNLRTLGYVMNPVTFYYCFGPDDRTVEVILAEITNTPWNERHTYGLAGSNGDRDLDQGLTNRPHRFAKAFHISPFMSMEQEYEWRFSTPGQRLVVHMSNHSEEAKLFDATLLLQRREITGRSLASALARHPWMTARVAAGIYWQALRLRLKRAPYFDHPDQRTAA